MQLRSLLNVVVDIKIEIIMFHDDKFVHVIRLDYMSKDFKKNWMELTNYLKCKVRNISSNQATHLLDITIDV